MEILSEIKAELKELLVNAILPTLRRTIGLVTMGNNRILKLLEGKELVLVVESTTGAV